MPRRSSSLGNRSAPALDSAPRPLRPLSWFRLGATRLLADVVRMLLIQFLLATSPDRSLDGIEWPFTWTNWRRGLECWARGGNDARVS